MSTNEAPKPVEPFASGGIVKFPTPILLGAHDEREAVIGVRSDAPVQVHTFPNGHVPQCLGEGPATVSMWLRMIK